MDFERKKGFTLVEVLIVVVIIGILAALIIPRMVATSEKAKIAEAAQMLGVLKRAQDTYMTLTGSSQYVFVQPGVNTNWTVLGLKRPSRINFDYGCTPDADNYTPGYCYAFRNGDSTDGDIQINGNMLAPTRWWCHGNYTCPANHLNDACNDPCERKPGL